MLLGFMLAVEPHYLVENGIPNLTPNNSAPIWDACQEGYGRRGNRFPRLRFKTVLATLIAHGSSVRQSLSRMLVMSQFESCPFGAFATHSLLLLPYGPGRVHGAFGSQHRLVPLSSI